jgi:hypothetical protein
LLCFAFAFGFGHSGCSFPPFRCSQMNGIHLSEGNRVGRAEIDLLPLI